MARIDLTEACLRFEGDDLIPADVSFLLGVEPTKAGIKGSVWMTLKSGKQINAKSGYWHLQATSESPGDLEKQISELIAALKADQQTVRSLVTRYNGNLFTGLFLKSSNEGLDLSAKTLKLIGSLGLSLAVDIYGGDEPEVDLEDGKAR